MSADALDAVESPDCSGMEEDPADCKADHD